MDKSLWLTFLSVRLSLTTADVVAASMKGRLDCVALAVQIRQTCY